jgi:hypothetical protein
LLCCLCGTSRFSPSIKRLRVIYYRRSYSRICICVWRWEERLIKWYKVINCRMIEGKFQLVQHQLASIAAACIVIVVQQLRRCRALRIKPILSPARRNYLSAALIAVRARFSPCRSHCSKWSTPVITFSQSINLLL